jgi:hypothetical protein
VKNTDEPQTVEAGFAVEAGIDLEAAHRFTESVRGKRVELARATVRAITVNKFLTLDRPLHIHHLPLNLSV